MRAPPREGDVLFIALRMQGGPMSAATTDLQIIQVPIDELRPDPANPRKIGDHELDALTKRHARPRTRASNPGARVRQGRDWRAPAAHCGAAARHEDGPGDLHRGRRGA